MTTSPSTLPLAEAAAVANAIVAEVGRAVIGKRDVLQLILAGLLADGHVLLDDLPGVAKTLTARSIATAAGLQFARVQFTPDLLPADITGSLVLDPGTQRPEVDAMLVSPRGVTAVEPAPAPGWSLPAAAGPVALRLRLGARAWGRHTLGELWARVRRPGGLIFWEGPLAVGPDIRILPAPRRLNRLLRPVEPPAVAGAHLARVRGSGTDFAELRPYASGDRLRDLSWSTSARLGEPWVIVHHPERTGTVLLVLDAFGERHDDDMSREALARAARSAWAVAAAHLRAQDRVGLLALGPRTAWLPPGGGRRARWLLLDELLGVGQAVEDWRHRHWRARPSIPVDALVVGVTALRSPGFLGDLVHYRRAGHTTVALVVDTMDLLPRVVDQADRAVQRLWRAERELRRQALHRGGVPAALVTAREGVAPAVSLLRRAIARHHLARGRHRGVPVR